MDGTPRACVFHPVSFPPCTIHSTNRRMILLLGLLVGPITSYILTYWPLCRILHRPYGVHELMAMHRFIWHISTTNVCNPFISSAWYTWPLNTSPQRAFLSSWQSRCHVGRLGSTDLLSVALLENCRLARGLLLLLFAANFLQWAAT